MIGPHRIRLPRGTEPRFLGHVGGDDFVLLVGSDDAESVANAVTTGFDASAPLLYADEDLKRGQLETIGRSGTRMNTPLMTISMGISSTSRREFRAPHDAVAVATELKALAKESRGSCWRVDRRQTG